MDTPIKMDTVKAFCPKCFMTFEAGKNSSRATKHCLIVHCDKIPCNRAGSNCIRRFSSINSANRHTYCYTQEQVNNWSEALKISSDLNFNFGNLSINDSDISEYIAESEDEELMFPEKLEEGPPYKYSNSLTISEVFEVAKRKMGKEFPEQSLNLIRDGFMRMGYTSAEVIRTRRMNQGNWEFLYRDFKSISYIVGLSHILKKILSKKAKKSEF
jgi:hypothetical protein